MNLQSVNRHRKWPSKLLHQEIEFLIRPSPQSMTRTVILDGAIGRSLCTAKGQTFQLLAPKLTAVRDEQLHCIELWPIQAYRIQKVGFYASAFTVPLTCIAV